MRKLSLVLATVLLLVLAVLPAAAQEGTVLDIAVGTDDFSILVLAVQNADPAVAEILAGPGPITVFAPTNQAFRNLASSFNFELSDLLADTSLLTQLLQYHVVSGVLTSGQLIELDGQVIPSALPNTGIGVTVRDGGLIVNGVVRVIEPFDVRASNGIVHTLNNIIFPGYIRELLNNLSTGAAVQAPEADVEEAPDYGDTILGVAQDAGDFETLIAAVEATEMVRFLSGGPFTVFAPTDEAFDALFETLGLTAEDVLAMPDLVETVLRYHIVDGVVTAEDVVALDGDVVHTVLNSVLISDGEPVSIDVVDGDVVLNDGQATVVATDIEASNGLIHVIDGVLIPQEVIDLLVDMGLLEITAPEEVEEPAAEVEEEEAGVDLGNSIAGVAAGNEDFSILLQIVEATGMTNMLFRGGPFTVFAPTNAAFEELLAGLGVDLNTALSMPELLAATLRYHIVDGVVTAEDVVARDGGQLNTVLNSVMISDGDPISVDVVDGEVVLNGGQATVIATDIEASNGIIHVIDGVLIPQEVLAALGLQ